MADLAAQEQAVLHLIDESLDEALERLKQMLRIPSISTDPAYAMECARCANAFLDELKDIGFSARRFDTDGHPIVVAKYDGAGQTAPRVLFYGHYDVQPPDPLELWETEPFNPQILTRPDGSRFIRARGVSDDKAQVRTFVEACRSWMKVAGRLPCNVTIFLEGEEESGSPSIIPFLDCHADELRADIALACDTHMWDRDTPAITVALRGMAAGEVTVKAAEIDLHSGLYGGPACNPIVVLANILSQLKDTDGHVTLEGFYDKVPEPPEELTNLWSCLEFDADAFLVKVGLSVPAGETGRTVLEQIWSRPTAEVNGFSGGYTGPGFKTVIPAQASAKVSFRLVGDQDPIAVWTSFESFVRARLPNDCQVVFTQRSGSPALTVSVDNPYLAAARTALNEEWATKTVLVGGGGSIPIPLHLKRYLGVETILPGFGLEDDAIHSPNEKYELKSFHKGQRSWARILARIGAMGCA